MILFGQSAFAYIRRQLEERDDVRGKLMFMMPALPPRVVQEIGNLLYAYAGSHEDVALPILRVSKPLSDEWQTNGLEDRNVIAELRGNGWLEDQRSLTYYRNFIREKADACLVVLLIGVDRVTDSSSMEDFHQCSFQNIWREELESTYSAWSHSVLKNVAYEEDTIRHFDTLLNSLTNRGLADALQISTFLETLDFTPAQDGRDAERILLTNLETFGLPLLGNFRPSSTRNIAGYIDDALEFFSYDAFLDDRAREKTLKVIGSFAEKKLSEGIFDPADRPPYSSDAEFIQGIQTYVKTGSSDERRRLLQCDFVSVRDIVLQYREPKAPTLPRSTAKKLAGTPIEVILTAIWETLGDFRKSADEHGLFAHEILTSIDIQSELFKHDCDGSNQEERHANAQSYLRRLLGGIDPLIERHLEESELGGSGRVIRCNLVQDDLRTQSARTGEPLLSFKVSIDGTGLERPTTKQFAWRLPVTDSYRVALELIQWAASALNQTDGYCLPVFQVAFYEELMLAKDEDETRRVLLNCLRDEHQAAQNLLRAPGLDPRDPLTEKLNRLAYDYDAFIQIAADSGLHTAFDRAWDSLRKDYETTYDSYVRQDSLRNSSLAALLFKPFLILRTRDSSDSERWMWEPYEESCVVTVLHPALLEMLHAQTHFLLSAFSSTAAAELKAPGARRFRDFLWRSFVDMAAIQMPLSGLIKDRNRVLDTDVRGSGLIHRIGSAQETEASLTTRLMLRYDAFEDDDLSDSDLFRKSRESALITRILDDYRKLHPHADDGINIAIYHNGDIQPLIAAIDEYLRNTSIGQELESKKYVLSVTVFSESNDDSSAARWVNQWKDRWTDSEDLASLSHYRSSELQISHRIIAPENDYRQFVRLIDESLECDIVFLIDLIRAGNQGNDFENVATYDVLTRTLKFPILEKPFCAFRDPSKKLQRARVLSNRQFRLTTCHAELMALMKSRVANPTSSHVVLGYGDYSPWQGVVDVLHRKAEWVVCIDPNVDERLIAEKGSNRQESREIIGFGSGVGSHGESNFTISTEQFRHVDVLRKLEASIREVYTGWNSETYAMVAKRVLDESQHLSGLSLVRATGIGEYVRDFMAYSLVRKLLRPPKGCLCDQLISLDAYQHWFESADSGMRPDLLWVVATVEPDDRISLDLRLIECKLAKRSDAHLEKAREQLENGLRHLVSAFLPKMDDSGEDRRPDQRYWWLQLYRLIASKAEISETDQSRVLTSLERLAEGEYDIRWRATAITFWTDGTGNEPKQEAVWTHAFDGHELGIGVVSAGSEFVRTLCEHGWEGSLPWDTGSLEVCFERELLASETSGEEEGQGSAPPSSPLQNIAPEQGEIVAESRTADQIEAAAPAVDLVTIPDRVLLGIAFPGSRKVFWEFGHKDLNNRHILIFGSSGMGKTYTIQCLLTELGQRGQNSLIADYTNGFFDNQLEPEFKDRLHPLQHIVRREPLSINPFRQQAETLGGEPLPETPSTTAQRVSGVFSEVYNFGDQQKSVLYQAVKAGIESRLFDTLMERADSQQMTLEDLIPELESIAEAKGPQAQVANSVISKLRPFLDQNPFGIENVGGWDRLFTDGTHRCHVIQLAGFLKDAARLITEFTLIDLYWYYRGRGSQSKPRVLVLDEVQNLDHRDESPLAQLLREGRKFGFSLVLATQIMSNLDRDEKDRLFLAAHKLFFRPADTELKTYAEIASITTGERADEWIKKLAALKKGECYSLGPSLNEATGQLETKAFRIKIVPLSDRIGGIA